MPASYEFSETERLLERYRRDWNQITACVYWRDVLNGHADFYVSLGIETLTAGHIYDPAFLDRLRAIIDRSDAVSSIEFGSHIFYSVALGKPVSLERQEIEYGPGGREDLPVNRTPAWREAIERLRKSLEAGGLTEADVQSVREMIGVDEHKSPEGLGAILEKAEELYRARHSAAARVGHVGRLRIRPRLGRTADRLLRRPPRL